MTPLYISDNSSSDEDDYVKKNHKDDVSDLTMPTLFLPPGDPPPPPPPPPPPKPLSLKKRFSHSQYQISPLKPRLVKRPSIVSPEKPSSPTSGKSSNLLPLSPTHSLRQKRSSKEFKEWYLQQKLLQSKAKVKLSPSSATSPPPPPPPQLMKQNLNIDNNKNGKKSPRGGLWSPPTAATLPPPREVHGSEVNLSEISEITPPQREKKKNFDQIEQHREQQDKEDEETLDGSIFSFLTQEDDEKDKASVTALSWITSSTGSQVKYSAEEREVACCQIQRIFRGMRTRQILMEDMGIAKRRKWQKRTKSLSLTKCHSDMRRAARMYLRDKLPVRSSMMVAIRSVCCRRLQIWWTQRIKWKLTFNRKCQLRRQQMNLTSKYLENLENIIRIQKWIRCVMQRRKYVVNIKPAVIQIQACARAFIYRRMFVRELRLRHTSGKKWKHRKLQLGKKMLKMQHLTSSHQSKETVRENTTENRVLFSDPDLLLLSDDESSVGSGACVSRTSANSIATSDSNASGRKRRSLRNRKAIVSSRWKTTTKKQQKKYEEHVEETEDEEEEEEEEEEGEQSLVSKSLLPKTKFGGRLGILAKRLAREETQSTHSSEVSSRRALTRRRQNLEKRKKKKQQQKENHQPMLGDPEVNALLPDPLSLYRPPSPKQPSEEDYSTATTTNTSVVSSVPTLPNQVALSPTSSQISCSDMSTSTSSTLSSYNRHHPKRNWRVNTHKYQQYQRRTLEDPSIFNDEILQNSIEYKKILAPTPVIEDNDIPAIDLSKKLSNDSQKKINYDSSKHLMARTGMFQKTSITTVQRKQYSSVEDLPFDES